MSVESVLYIVVTIAGIFATLIGAFSCVKKFTSICCTIETNTETNTAMLSPTSLATLVKSKFTPRKTDATQTSPSETSAV